ncbi:HTTM domain-containing protein [Actinomycetospora soli]|uniref:HTTM domain-containing protein n=1 Tax=Actinomycetospora soli TaxID=2893887 RepID=UPI001E642F1D|nr:HTTM domain-containing protein [Actinomycetospora soli]MCD2187019.1 HTTM domain-containing protein [Actinomycetospora soli]
MSPNDGARLHPVQAWNSFWFAPTSTTPLALLRIVFGLVVFVWLLSLAPDLLTFFGPSGLMPSPPPLGPGAWTLLFLLDSSAAILALWAIAVVASVATVLGFQTRLATLLVFVAVVSFERRNNMIFNGGDGLLRVLAFLLVLAPAGAALSWDRWRSSPDRFWQSPLHAPWAMRLIQIHVSVIYLSTVWAKLQGRLWGDGLATSFALRIGDVQRIATPAFLTDSAVASNIMTFGALGTEFAIGVLVWNRWARPWVLGLGVLLHLSIEISMVVGFFSTLMVTTYLSFLSPAWADRFVAKLRRRYEIVTKRRRPPSVVDVTGGSRPATDQQPPVTSEGAMGMQKGLT